MAGEENIEPKSRSSFMQSYDIDFGSRLPEFDSPGGIAFAASSNVDISQSVYAFMHHQNVPMRDRVTDRLSKKSIKFYNNLVDQGIYLVSDGGSEARRFISIIERPLGPSLDSAAGRERINIHFLHTTFLKSVLICLAELHGNKITHRALTPANIFFAGPDGEEIVLGECFTAPAGSVQPASYEVMHRAQCVPFGRGEGEEEDDFFAFGASLMTLVISDNIKRSDGTDDFLIRLDKGSYRYLEGQKKVPDMFEVLIRGLMSDEADHRWTLSEVAQFIDGHVPRLSTGTDAHGLSKPVTFAGGNYTDRRALAHAMSKDIPQTVKYFSEEKFSNWVSANLTSEVLSENAEAAIMGATKTHNKTSSAELVARICTFLDPTGPLRYDGLVFSYDGLGPVIAAGFIEEGEELLEKLDGIIKSTIVLDISKIAGDKNEILQEEVGKIVWGADFLKKEKLGFGMERLLYEYNPKLPCQGDKFTNYWVRGAKGAIIRLDKVLGSTGSGSNLLDKHISAFCSAKVKNLDAVFSVLPNGDLPSGLNASRFIDSMGTIQARTRTGPLPNLCQKLCEGLRPIVKAIHYKPRREMLAKKLDSLASSGSLANVSGQLKLAQHRATDEQEFNRACRAFSQLDTAREQNKLLIKSDDPRAIYKGYNGISFVGMILVVVSVILTVAGS